LAIAFICCDSGEKLCNFQDKILCISRYFGFLTSSFWKRSTVKDRRL